MTRAEEQTPPAGIPLERVPPADLRDAVIAVAARDGATAAAELVGRHWDEYATSSPAELLAAVRALPGEVFVDNAGMVVAANYLQHVVSGGEPHRFERDPHVSMSPEDARGSLAEQLIGLTGTTATERTRGAYDRAAAAAVEARRRLDASPDRDVASVRPQLPHFFVQWGRALEDAGGAQISPEFEYEESHRLGLQTEQAQVARRAAGHLAWHHATRGRLTAAGYWLQRARETGEENPRYDVVIHLAAALIAADRRNPDESLAELAVVDSLPTGEYWAAALWVASLHLHTAAERTALESMLKGEVDRRPVAVTTGGMNGGYLRATRLRLGHPLAPVTPATPQDVALEATREYQRGDFHRAIEVAHASIDGSAPPRPRAVALLVTAAAAHGLGRATVARDHFLLAHSIIEREQTYTTYDVISRDHLEMLADGTIGAPIPVPVRTDGRVDTSVLLAGLTKRERQVLTMLPSRRSVADIASELFISPNTLKATTRRLYRKLGVTSREGAADIAHRAGLHIV